MMATAEGQTDRKRSMIHHQLLARGIADPRVLAAMSAVPRHEFVPAELAGLAYDDSPLPIGGGQTISQPYIVAYMAEALALTPRDRVLEVGTGSGYAAAVLALLADEVYTIERDTALYETARHRLDELGYDNVSVRLGDGSLGWPEEAPFDAIAVAAGGPRVPRALLAQLADGGRLVIPIGSAHSQSLVRFERRGEQLMERSLGAVRFVPLVGSQGWR